MKSKILLILITSLSVLSLMLAGCAAPATPTEAAPAAPAATEPPAAPAAPAATEPPAAAPAATEAPAAPPEPIKIGALLPLTGGDALEGGHIRDGHTMAIEEINAAGGIKCLNGAPLKLVLGDSQGIPEVGNSETERLITQEKVVVITGALHSGVVLPTTEISEKYKIPYLVTSSIANKIVDRGLKYVLLTRTDLNSFVRDTVNFSKDHGAKTAATLTSNLEIGMLGKEAYAAAIPAAGLTLATQVEFASGTPDFSDSILKIKSADPDVLFIIANTIDAIPIVKQMKSLNYWPKMGVANPGGGFADPAFTKNLGALAENMVFSEEWSPMLKTPNSQEINAKFKKQFGYNMSTAGATSYASVHLIAAAIEKACSSDPVKINDALHQTDFKTGVWNFEFPDGISFDETGLIKNAPDVIYQIQNGEQPPVYPDNAALAKLVWPVPGWSDR